MIGIEEKKSSSLNNLNFKLFHILPLFLGPLIRILICEVLDATKWVTCHENFLKSVLLCNFLKNKKILLYTLITWGQPSRKQSWIPILYYKIFKIIDQEISSWKFIIVNKLKRSKHYLPRKINPMLLITTNSRNNSNVQ